MAHGDFKHLTRGKVLIKYCIINHLKLLKILNMIDITGVLLQWSINFYIKTSGQTIKNENISNKELPEELHKPIITKLQKRKVHSSFIDNISGEGLPDMQLISRLIKELVFYYVLLTFSVNTHGLFV